MFDAQSPSLLETPLALPSGQIIRNRIAKVAMEENLADGTHLPGAQLRQLYRTWGAGGAGLIITGNVMVAADAVTGPGGVVLDAQQPVAPFREWAEAGKAEGAWMWMQISHPGRQVFVATHATAIAPSAARVDMGKHSSLFFEPRAIPRQISERSSTSSP
ncbi:hypothetical protein [Arenibacterium halophilum]|uniref:oxidoreductase n=1 Tax=Arenibacterium halophilum TaxID=2583821 RepID=UPI002482756A|nr:hypothetical protein [Arenibacterium halophilum]